MSTSSTATNTGEEESVSTRMLEKEEVDDEWTQETNRGNAASYIARKFLSEILVTNFYTDAELVAICYTPKPGRVLKSLHVEAGMDGGGFGFELEGFKREPQWMSIPSAPKEYSRDKTAAFKLSPLTISRHIAIFRRWKEGGHWHAIGSIKVWTGMWIFVEKDQTLIAYEQSKAKKDNGKFKPIPRVEETPQNMQIVVVEESPQNMQIVEV